MSRDAATCRESGGPGQHVGPPFRSAPGPSPHRIPNRKYLRLFMMLFSNHRCAVNLSTAAKMTPSCESEELSIVYGPTDQPLWEKTLAALIREQAQRFSNKSAVIVPWQNATLSYNDLLQRGLLVARSILAAGIKRGDRVGILAGNCHEYLEVVLGAGYIGCPTVVLNNTYTPMELQSALSRTCEYLPS